MGVGAERSHVEGKLNLDIKEKRDSERASELNWFPVRRLVGTVDTLRLLKKSEINLRDHEANISWDLLFFFVRVA